MEAEHMCLANNKFFFCLIYGRREQEALVYLNVATIHISYYVMNPILVCVKVSVQHCGYVGNS